MAHEGPRLTVSEEDLERLDGAVAELSLDGDVRGHIEVARSRFWSPGSPLRMQPNLWLSIRWSDGTREVPDIEDYPPEWHSAQELLEGHLDITHDRRHSGDFQITWLTGVEADHARRLIRGDA